MVTFNLNTISEYRNSLMGVATICILLTHAPAYGVILPFHLNALLSAAQIGVMIFFFVSGVGLYYSLNAKEYNNKDIIKWYKKRFTRLFLPYLIIYIPFCALNCHIHNENIFMFLFDISTLSFWFGRPTCWFVNMLVPLYIISPLWLRLLKRTKYPIIPTILIVSFCLLQNGYWIQASLFFIGFWLGKYIKNGVCLKFKHLVLILLCVLISLILYYTFGIGYLLWYLSTPFIILSCTFLKKIKNQFIHKIFLFFGKISLESYLFNITIYTWISFYNLLPNYLFQYRYIFVIIFGTLFAYFVNNLCDILIKNQKSSLLNIKKNI